MLKVCVYMYKLLRALMTSCAYVMLKTSVNVCNCLWLHTYSLYGMKCVGAVHTHSLTNLDNKNSWTFRMNMIFVQCVYSMV